MRLHHAFLTLTFLASQANGELIEDILEGPRFRSRINDENVGTRDRFWKHHVETKSLVFADGVDYYDKMQSCLDSKLSAKERKQLETARADERKMGKQVITKRGMVIGSIIENAILPVQVKAVQSLAACVRELIPKLAESRAMYVEFQMEEDTDGLGGNCPTHLAPLVAIFFPEVVAEQDRTLEFAYALNGWGNFTKADRQVNRPRYHAIPEPKDAGIRASEHLTYRDFKNLANHHDGDTAFTLNYAFSDEYEGGDFYIKSGQGRNTQYDFIRPSKYDAIVFLGGRYMHGVTEIKGGNREMWSTEFWYYPDLPFGETLWNTGGESIEPFILQCNRELAEGREGPCTAKLAEVEDLEDEDEDWDEDEDDEEEEEEEEEEPNTWYSRKRPNRVVATALDPGQYSEDVFRPEEPNFLIPKTLEPGETMPIRWRKSLEPIDGEDGETFVVGFPPELHKEFQAYIERNGMMNVARKILYENEPIEPGEHQIYTLDDGMKWGAMIQGSWDTDLIWLDPADEECFESLIGVLRRGGFDKVLEGIGKTFDLKSLMIQGVGALFLSEYEHSENLHHDLEGSRGTFYNVIVPVYIPEDGAKFYLADADNGRGKATLSLDPNMGVVVGAESDHGTGECNYRDKKDFRLSFAVYMADIAEDNVELVADDSTSLWPTEGDIDWFWAQQGRFWSSDGKNNIKTDKGRKPMNVQDKRPDCEQLKDSCESDPTGIRLECPKTCKLYLEDDVYYLKLKEMISES